MTNLLMSYTFQIVALGSTLLGAICGIVGNFSVLRKESLIGDAVSHAALPGICISYILVGRKDLLSLLLGAFVSGIIAMFFLDYLGKRISIKFDNLLALILSTFFGLGVVLITYIQKLPGANKAGLNKFIFGQASAILKEDIYIMIVVCIITLVIIISFWNAFKLIIFDKIYARIIYGEKVRFYKFLLSFCTVICIIIGLEMVGVIMMSSLLIVPAVAARQWTNNFSTMAILSAIIGAVSGFLGTLISSSSLNIPTGPTIVLILSVVIFISIIFSPKRGLIGKIVRRKREHKKIISSLSKGE